jgi:predicted nucleic acid-binding Zn ribbon protein
MDDDWDDNDDECEDDDGNDEGEMPCPYCGQPIYDDSPRCAHCGQYLSSEDAAAAPKPMWIVLGVVLCLLLIFSWLSWR